ncbi:MAG: PqqD family protein [Planctomycetes bacterium]|nr:PqqD family protein [Planctomycetota bacterium]
MKKEMDLGGVYAPSEDVVARDIEGELIIVPLVSGMAEDEDALFTLNETGRAVWNRLDGKRSLRDLAAELSAEYDDPDGEIEADVLGLVEELARRKMIATAEAA